MVFAGPGYARVKNRIEGLYPDLPKFLNSGMFLKSCFKPLCDLRNIPCIGVVEDLGR